MSEIYIKFNFTGPGRYLAKEGTTDNAALAKIHRKPPKEGSCSSYRLEAEYIDSYKSQHEKVWFKKLTIGYSRFSYFERCVFEKCKFVSALETVKFDECSFSDADFSSANLYGPVFGSGCKFNQVKYKFNTFITQRPLYISGLNWVVNVTDDVMSIGCQSHLIQDWAKMTHAQIAKLNSFALPFWKVHGKSLLAMAKAHQEKCRGAKLE